MSTPEVIGSVENIPKTIANDQVNIADAASESPVWLTRDYVEQCLRMHYQDAKLKVKSCDIRAALGKGENYGGILTRIKCEFKRSGNGSLQSGNYIVKTSYEENEFARKTMEPYDIFNREMGIYENVLPKLNALLQEIGDSEQIFAETMAIDRSRSALIFEDLNVREFYMPDRLQGLDMKLTKMILRKLAKMHATSAVLNEREKGTLESYDRGMFNRHTDNYLPGFEGLFEALQRRVSQWPDYQQYAQQLHKLKPMYAELCKRVFDATPGFVNVLAHGDLWTNNVLVKYDSESGEALDVIIIDFQYAVWSTPAIDLFYFFNTSLKEHMHIHAQEELMQCYYEVLADTLRKLLYKAPIPSLHNFHLQMQQKEFYAFNSTCVVLPVQRLEETDDADYSAIMKQDERGIRFKDTCYRNPYVHRIVRQLLPVYERKGLLDPNQ